MKRYVIDLAVMNVIALAISLLAYFSGSNLIDALILVLFIEGGIVLVLAGLFGFLLTQPLLWAFRRFFLGIDAKEEDWETQAKEKRSTGKRLIVLGAALMAETTLLALAIM